LAAPIVESATERGSGRTASTSDWKWRWTGATLRRKITNNGCRTADQRKRDETLHFKLPSLRGRQLDAPSAPPADASGPCLPVWENLKVQIESNALRTHSCT
jgi:hypothetical protein